MYALIYKEHLLYKRVNIYFISLAAVPDFVPLHDAFTSKGTFIIFFCIFHQIESIVCTYFIRCNITVIYFIDAKHFYLYLSTFVFLTLRKPKMNFQILIILFLYML